MKIAHYRNVTGEFIDITDAFPDPLDVGKFLIPANATKDLPEGTQNHWNGTAWEHLPDYRGQKVYNTLTYNESSIDYLGEIKAGYTLQKPPSFYHKYENDNWAPDESKKTALIEQLSTKINAETDQKILSGFIYQGKEFYLSLENQFNYKSAYDARALLSYPFTVKGKDEFISFANAAEFEAFYLAGFAYVQQCIGEGWAKKEALKTKSMTELLALI